MFKSIRVFKRDIYIEKDYINDIDDYDYDPLPTPKFQIDWWGKLSECTLHIIICFNNNKYVFGILK